MVNIFDIRVRSLMQRFKSNGVAVWAFLRDALDAAGADGLPIDPASLGVYADFFPIRPELFREILDYCLAVNLFARAAAGDAIRPAAPPAPADPPAPRSVSYSLAAAPRAAARRNARVCVASVSYPCPPASAPASAPDAPPADDITADDITDDDITVEGVPPALARHALAMCRAWNVLAPDASPVFYLDAPLADALQAFRDAVPPDANPDIAFDGFIASANAESRDRVCAGHLPLSLPEALMALPDLPEASVDALPPCPDDVPVDPDAPLDF